MFFTFGFAFWVAVKLGGALVGAQLGSLQATNADISDGAT